MKVKVNHEIETFKPIELEITFESQKEFDMFYFLFNYAPLCDIINNYTGVHTARVRQELDKAEQYKCGEFDFIVKRFEALMKERL